MTPPPDGTRTRFEHADPILNVRDMATTLLYYVDVLGFAPAPWGAEDVGKLYEEYRASGARIRGAPRNHSWAYEMQVEDPDGHVLRFGSEPRGDLPVEDGRA